MDGGYDIPAMHDSSNCKITLCSATPATGATAATLVAGVRERAKPGRKGYTGSAERIGEIVTGTASARREGAARIGRGPLCKGAAHCLQPLVTRRAATERANLAGGGRRRGRGRSGSRRAEDRQIGGGKAGGDRKLDVEREVAGIDEGATFGAAPAGETPRMSGGASGNVARVGAFFSNQHPGRPGMRG